VALSADLSQRPEGESPDPPKRRVKWGDVLSCAGCVEGTSSSLDLKAADAP